MESPINNQLSISRDGVLAKAFLRASEELGLNQEEQGKVLGIHRTGISKIRQKMSLKPDSKQGELALLLIRLARALHALSDGDQAWMHHFMRSRNTVTLGVPAEQIASIQGLVRVVEYLDAIRGKV